MDFDQHGNSGSSNYYHVSVPCLEKPTLRYMVVYFPLIVPANDTHKIQVAINDFAREGWELFKISSHDRGEILYFRTPDRSSL